MWDHAIEGAGTGSVSTEGAQVAACGRRGEYEHKTKAAECRDVSPAVLECCRQPLGAGVALVRSNARLAQQQRKVDGELMRSRIGASLKAGATVVTEVGEVCNVT